MSVETELLLLGGRSGVGKSSVAFALHDVLTADHGRSRPITADHGWSTPTR